MMLKRVSSAFRFRSSRGDVRIQSLSLNARSSSFDAEDELGFAWITPNALAKSLEGAILARLLSIPGIEMVGARMVQPSDEMVDMYVQTMEQNASDTEFKNTVVHFVNTELRRKGSVERGYPNYLMLLLFKGKNAREKLSVAVGSHMPHSAALGNTIRGAFGDYNRRSDGTIDYFQPSVISPLTASCNLEYLRVFANFLQQDGGFMLSLIHI